MKRLFFLGVFSFLLLGSSLLADEIGEHPYFKAVSGKWTGEGDLTTVDGLTIHVKEVWEGKVGEDGTFVVEGDREWGEEKQVFKWVFSFNSTNELYECEYTVTGVDDPMRFEVSVNDISAELKTPFGEPGGEIIISNSIVEKKLEGKVSVVDGDQLEVLKGTIVHERSKE